MQEQKAKTFKGGINGETLVVIIIPMIVAGVLIWYGGKINNPLFPPEGDAISRFIFVFGPIALGSMILFFSILTLISNLLITITITPAKIHFKQGTKKFECKWEVLAYAPPKPRQKFLRSFTVSDGTMLGRVNSAFFPKFDIVAKIIKTAKDQAKNAGYQV